MMRSLRTKIRLAPLLGVASAWTGCAKEPARWDVDVLAPLVTTSMTLGDLIPDSLLASGSNGAITLVYRSTLFAVDMDTVLAAPDTTFVYGAGLDQGLGTVNLPAGFVFDSQNNLTRFDIDDLQLRTLVLREGTLKVNMTNELTSGILGTFSFPGSTFPDGSSTMTAFAGAGSSSQPGVTEVQRDLAGVVFDLRGPTYTDVNTLATNINLTLDPNGSGATVTEGDSVLALLTYGGLVPQYARGYFGNRVIEVGPDTTALDLFSSIVSGTLDVDDVDLRLKVENGLGVDIQVMLDHLSAINTRTGSTVDLSHTILQGPMNLNRATDLGNGFVPSFYNAAMDQDNSNVDLFLENMPDRLGYAVELRLNPLGNVSNGHDFLYYDSRLRADLELELPLRLIASSLTLEKIIEPDLPGSADGHALISGKLNVFATNGFPFSANLQLAIVDEFGNLMAQLPVDGSITTGLLGGDGLVHAATDSRITAVLSADHAHLLYTGGKLRLRAVFNTADQVQHVQIYDHYRLDLQVTTGANYMVNGNE